jgi:hypothetical protein
LTRADNGRDASGDLSAEHFSVDGTMLKAWASMKSFRPKSATGEGPGNGPGDPPQPGRNREADFRKTKRSNATHASTTDKDARLYRKGAGQESRLGVDAQLIFSGERRRRIPHRHRLETMQVGGESRAV